MADQQPCGDTPSPVTRLLRKWQQGDAAAGADLVAAIYADLKRLAASRLRQERQDHTLQPTALVHAAWLRLGEVHAEWQSRAHFFAMAAVSMRRILVDHARHRNAAKRDLGAERVALDDVLDALPSPMPDDRLLALDEALTRLEALDARQARVVELRYFSGLSIDETAAVLGVSAGTVKRDWLMAKTWIRRCLDGDLTDP